MPMSLLSEMYKLQLELNEVLEQNKVEKGRLTELMVMNMVTESAEALAHFTNETKPWKPTEPDLEKVDEEVIDVLFFVLNYFTSRGIRPGEIFSMYFRKHQVNIQRVKEKLQVSGGTH